MKKLSTINEREENGKPFSYIATVVVKGNIDALSEGDAGYEADSVIESLPGYVSHQIDVINEGYITESNIADKFMDDYLNDSNKIKYAANKIEDAINDTLRDIGEVEDMDKIALIQAVFSAINKTLFK